jgi:hypothetical protein
MSLLTNASLLYISTYYGEPARRLRVGVRLGADWACAHREARSPKSSHAGERRTDFGVGSEGTTG